MPCTKQDGGVPRRLEITLSTTDRSRQALADALRTMWAQINVNVIIQIIPGRGLFNPCNQGGVLACRTFDAALYTWVGSDSPDFMGMYNCGGIPTQANGWGGMNYPGWCNTTADQALLAAETNPDIVVSPAARKSAYGPFFTLWTEEVPVIPLSVSAMPLVARTGFKNYTCGPTASAPCGWNSWMWELVK